jgi:hypothetical protein
VGWEERFLAAGFGFAFGFLDFLEALLGDGDSLGDALGDGFGESWEVAL